MMHGQRNIILKRLKDGRADRRDEASSFFLKFCNSAEKLRFSRDHGVFKSTCDNKLMVLHRCRLIHLHRATDAFRCRL